MTIKGFKVEIISFLGEYAVNKVHENYRAYQVTFPMKWI